MLDNLVTSLLLHERVRTTQARAKAARALAERMIEFAKQGDLAGRREVLRIVRDAAVVKRLFGEVAPRFAQQAGGYTRILRLGARLGDAASMVQLELVGAPPPVTEEKEKKAKKKEKKKI
jgi:large subunit ribosomal protein L17